MGKTFGRPPLPKAEKRSERILTYVTPAEYRAIKAHRKRGQTISDFTRETLLAACQAGPEPSPPPAGGGSHIADPPHTAHGGGPAHGGPRSMGPSSQHRASPQPQHGAPGAHQAQGSPHVADPPHGGPRSMGPSSQHRASPQPQHGAPGVHQTQGSPHVADPPPPPHTAPSQQQPAPAVTAEEVKRRLTQAGVEGWQAFTAADKDPQRVADILDRAGGLSPGAIFNRIVRPGA